ncbi:DNA-binding protein [Streptomyces sp. 8N114]|uniref:DNA-binding protein n=1 Tax=Streptomyces sp. 8N114 TaxID=3457419 RepID=UPI003FD03879
MAVGALRTVPLAGELTASLINRVAARYGLADENVLRLWTWHNSPTRHDGGRVRADAEVVLNEAGRHGLAELCGVETEVLARALPAFTVDDTQIGTGREATTAEARWRAAGAVVGPAAFGCRLCTARRTGQALRTVRYLPRCRRVCVRHGRWLLDADADHPLEHLDLGSVPEVLAAQRRWPGVARRAVRAGVEPEQVFTVAHAVVARWWERALEWEQEEVWPRRLHHLVGGSMGGELAWWRIVSRDAAIFPEVVTVAGALLEPAMAELAWRASGGMRPRARGDDDPFCRRLGERVGRDWLGPLVAADYGSPLSDWTGAVVRARRGSRPPGWRDDPWRLKREQQPATMAGLLRVGAAEQRSGGSGTRWRATVSAEQRLRISQLLDEAREGLEQVRGAQSGTTAEVARTLLEHLSQSVELIDRAVLDTAAAAVAAGVALEEVAGWSRLSAEELAAVLAAAGTDADGC